jgi:hypothetical protein
MAQDCCLLPRNPLCCIQREWPAKEVCYGPVKVLELSPRRQTPRMFWAVIGDPSTAYGSLPRPLGEGLNGFPGAYTACGTGKECVPSCTSGGRGVVLRTANECPLVQLGPILRARGLANGKPVHWTRHGGTQYLESGLRRQRLCTQRQSFSICTIMALFVLR